MRFEANSTIDIYQLNGAAISLPVARLSVTYLSDSTKRQRVLPTSFLNEISLI